MEWMNQRIFHKTSPPLFFEDTWLGDKIKIFDTIVLIILNTCSIQYSANSVRETSSSLLFGKPVGMPWYLVGLTLRVCELSARASKLPKEALKYETITVVLTERLWPFLDKSFHLKAPVRTLLCLCPPSEWSDKLSLWLPAFPGSALPFFL